MKKNFKIFKLPVSIEETTLKLSSLMEDTCVKINRILSFYFDMKSPFRARLVSS